MAVLETFRQTRQWWLLLAVVVPVVFAAAALAGLGGDFLRVDVGNLLAIIAPVLAAVSCLFASRRSDGSTRRGWAYLSLAASAWAVGQLVWTYYEVGLGIPSPFPGPADFLFLSFVPLAGLALFELTGSGLRAAGRFRIGLDALIVALGLLTLAWMLLLRETLGASDTTVPEKFLGLAYPLTDVVLVALVVSLLPRAHPGDRQAWYVLGAGLFSLAWADGLFAFLDLRRVYDPGFAAADAGWIAGFLLVAVAPLYHEGAAGLAAYYQQKIGSLLPHLTLVPVLVVALTFVVAGNPLDLASSALLVILVIFGAISQVATNRENLELVDDLEDSAARAKESEESARQVAVRLEEAQRVAKVGIWEWDPKTDYVWATDQTGLILDSPGMRFPVRLSQVLERIDQEDRATLVGHLARATNGQGAFRMDMRVGPRGVHQRWVHIRGDAGSSEHRQRVTGTIHDVTDRKQAEERLLESRSLLEEAQSLARVGNWEYDVAADRFDLSPEMYQILGVARTFHPSLDEFLKLVPEEERPHVLAALRKLYGTKGPQDVEHRIVRPDGVARWVHQRAQARPSPTGRVAKLFGTVHDITDRKSVEEERAVAVLRERELQQLKEMNDFKTQFINMAAHELRTPITPIRVLVHMLRSRAQADKRKKDTDALGVVDRNVHRLERLVEDLLSAARIQSQRLKLDRARIDVAKIIADSVHTFRPLAQERGLTLASSLAPGKMVVSGDGGRVSQVLYNLLDNALKFTPAGGTVAVEAEATSDGVQVRVKDSGAGLRADQLSRLFQPFSQVHDPETAPGVGGTGLGLYISRGIIEGHGGRMWCESAGPGQGSTFSFTLPRQELVLPATLAPEAGTE
jgi:PAS domain S-box-containing protein